MTLRLPEGEVRVRRPARDTPAPSGNASSSCAAAVRGRVRGPSRFRGGSDRPPCRGTVQSHGILRAARAEIPLLADQDHRAFSRRTGRSGCARSSDPLRGIDVVDQLVDMTERRLPPAAPAAQSSGGHASASFRRLSPSASGQHLHVGEHGHEVRVARPARHDVQVDVVDHARAGDAARGSSPG